MMENPRRFRLYDKVRIVEHEHFKGFDGMVIRRDMVDPVAVGDGILVMIGEEEDVVLGLGPWRFFSKGAIEHLKKNLKIKVQKASKRQNLWAKIY